MGGYQISYESFKTYVQNQARMAKSERERYEETKDVAYLGEAEGREWAVFELAKYLCAPRKEVKEMWLEV